MDGKEAQVAVSQLLLDKIRDDKYPSNTHMEMLEDSLPREMLDEYLEVLMDKVADEPYPSIDMLRRIQRVADSI
jgi:hypothetical protein